MQSAGFAGRLAAPVLVVVAFGGVGHAEQFDLSLDPASVPAESNIVAGSFGLDWFDLNPAVAFSVDRQSAGVAGSPIRLQAQPPTESAHGDIYRYDGGQVRVREETALGLTPGFFGDDLDAMQIQLAPGPDTVNINTVFPYLSVWRNSGFGGVDPADILLGLTTTVFASGVSDIGLSLGDAIDGLILMDVTPDAAAPGGFRREPNGVVDAGFDQAIFSLDPFSPNTLGGGGVYSSADLLVTSFQQSFAVWAGANSLGLLPGDNIDALSLIPEPATGLYLAIVAATLAARRRRRTPAR